MEELFRLVSDLKTIRKLPQFLFFDSIDFWNSFKVRESILEFKDKNADVDEIDFIIESSGGSPADSYRIIKTLRSNFNKVNIIIPFWAKSAATLLSLGGTTIILDDNAEFGPLDAQLKEESEDDPGGKTKSALIDEHSLNRIEKRAQELYHTMILDFHTSGDIKIKKSILSEQILNYIPQFYKPLLDKIDPYEIGRKKRSLEVGEKYAERILTLYNPSITEDNLVRFVDFIVNGCPDHGYVIDYEIVSAFLPNVRKSVDIGTEYKRALTQLSMYFIKNISSNKYIGFVDQAPEGVDKKIKIRNTDRVKKNKSGKK